MAQPWAALNLVMSSGDPIALADAASTIRLTRPVNTLPAPISKNDDTPDSAMNSTDSRHRTVAVICSIRFRTISGGSLTGRAVTLATRGTIGGLTNTCPKASTITSAAGCIRGQWNGADTGSIIARLTPCALATPTARSTAAFAPDKTT